MKIEITRNINTGGGCLIHAVKRGNQLITFNEDGYGVYKVDYELLREELITHKDMVYKEYLADVDIEDIKQLMFLAFDNNSIFDEKFTSIQYQYFIDKEFKEWTRSEILKELTKIKK